MLSFLLLILLFFLLYFFNKIIINYFSFISFFIFGKSSPAIYFYFLFFLPGIILHEVAHLLFATFLGVPVGNLEIFPRYEKEKKNWILGEVKIGKTDILRNGLIGLAPLILAILAIIFLVKFSLGIDQVNDIKKLSFSWQNLFSFYLILAFINTMFLSKEDQKTAFVIPLTLAIALFFLNFFGVQSFFDKIQNFLLELLSFLFLSLIITVLIDFLFILPFLLLVSFISKKEKF